MLLRFAWRNLWRNGRRTAITLGTVALATAVLIVAGALMRGMMVGALANATNLGVGEVQAHGAGYLVDRSFYTTVRAPEAALAAAGALGAGAAPRSYGFGLVAHEARSAGALFWGVDPARERTAFDLARHVWHGTFLGDEPAGGVVLGKKLAHTLGVEVGSELVVVVQAADGSLGNELFTVTGVLEAVGETNDRSAAIVHRDDFEALFVSGGRVHEIAVNGRGRVPLDVLEARIAAAVPDADVRTWRELLPVLADMLALFDAAMWIFSGIFMVAAGLGVMNTMLMATFERIRELGVQKALGATPLRVAGDVAAESVLLAVVGSVVGTAVGVALSVWLGRHGIDTSRLGGDLSFGGVAFDPVWRAVLVPRELVVPIVGMWVASVAAALYPAALVARLDPVRAMQHV